MEKFNRQIIEARERVAPGVMIINFIRRWVIHGRVIHRGRAYLVKQDENALEGLFIEVQAVGRAGRESGSPLGQKLGK